MDPFDRLCGKASGPVGIAVSGGSDSLALLVLAQDWAQRAGRELVAFTVDHRLRPEAADEARHVGRICAQRGIPHETLVWDAPVSKQALARRARHGLMARALRQRGGNRLLLGHTADDQCETFLMRARQGSTWYGLAGMQAVSLSPAWPEGQGVLLARPLLSRSRAALQTVLKDRGIGWIEDPSNRNPVYERVRMRALLQDQAGLKSRILACQDRLQALRTLEERLIGRWMASNVTQDAAGGFRLDVSGLPPQRLERALGLMLQIAGGREVPPRRDAVEPLAARLMADAPFQGATLGGVLVYRRQGQVILSAEPGIAGAAADPALARARFEGICALFAGDA
ncbi:MAG: tRNA lysidine(34) synthetase TilS [Hyphomonas sp.]|nr:tRNA lysidine(34) synthetase TilS [Hyphomonas sp.]